MIKNLLVLFFLTTNSFIYSQNIIKGKITGEKNEPVENASITIENIDTDDILAFAISDTNGNFKIEFKGENNNLRVVISSINYAKFSEKINTLSFQNLNYSLKEQVQKLSEVNIEVKPIQQRGDTISYNTKKFEGKEDRTLSDVLKKIPGIEVDPNGGIKYQGTAINKFYIEGKDLMAGQYSTLTNSMPKEAVNQLQILENHQPIRVLENSVPSYKAAINIKLKKNITLTGRADLGVGATPFLWNAKITPMIFTKKYQYLINYKSNNTGEEITSQLQTFSFDQGFEGITSDNETGAWLNITQTETPPINENRYLFNKTHLFSGNFLTNLKKDFEFKTNLNFTDNSVNRYSEHRTEVSILDTNGVKSNIHYYQTNNTSLNSNQLKTQMILTKNTKTFFLKNTFTYKGNWDKVNGNVDLNSSLVSQYTYSPGYSFQNSFSSIFGVGKKILNLKSTFNYINDKQAYLVEPFSNINLNEFPTTNANVVNQKIKVNTINTNNEASIIFSLKKISFIPTIGFDIERKNLSSNLFGEDSTHNYIDFGNNFKNDLIWTKFVPFSNFSINYMNDSFTLNINSQLKANSFKVNDDKNNFYKKTNKITFEPNFRFKYNFNSEFSKSFYGSINYNFGTINNLFPNYIFSSLNLSIQNSDIQQSISKNFGGIFEYKSVLYNLFANLNYDVIFSNTNNTISKNISDNGQLVISQVPTNNTSNNKRINLQISKYLLKLKSKVSFVYGLNKSLNTFIINNYEQAIISTGSNLNIKVNNNSFSWLTLNYDFTYSINNRVDFNSTKNLNNSVKAIFYIFEKNSISIFFDDYKYNFDNQTVYNNFMDLSYQYNLKKKKIDFELKWTNIFNTKTYNELILNNLGYTSNTINIRPSQALASIKFNFK